MEVIDDIIKPALKMFDMLEVERSTPLLGKLDSLALVTLVGTVEELIEEKTGKSISLLSADAFSQRRSPFRTVGSLAEYVQELLVN